MLEDNPQVNEQVTRALVSQGQVSQGHAVRSCTDVDSARQWLVANKVDLLVSDIVLQGALGTDFALEARSYDPELRVLFISGYSSIENGPWQTDEVGRTEFLAKPFSVSALLQHTARLPEYRFPGRSEDRSTSSGSAPETAHHAYNTLN